MMSCPVVSGFDSKWVAVAIALGIGAMDRKEIKLCDNLDEKCSLMLEKWIDLTKNNACLEDLVAALQKKNLNAMASCLTNAYYVSAKESETDSGNRVQAEGVGSSRPAAGPTPVDPKLLDMVTNFTPFKVNVDLPPKRQKHVNDEYKLPVDYKGEALIINITQFDHLEERKGAEHDTIHMRDLWNDLGFKVTEKEGRIEKATLEVTLKAFQDKLESDADGIKACVVYIGSHGEYGRIHASDKKYINLFTDFIYKITELSCLQGKPKLFIVNACQLFPREANDSASLRMPIKDTTICISSLPGTVSKRDIHLGSWYVNCLTLVFMKNAYKLDLESMLDEVSGVNIYYNIILDTVF